jgi:hypothetical protein
VSPNENDKNSEGMKGIQERDGILLCFKTEGEIVDLKTVTEAFRKKKPLEQRPGDKIPRKQEPRGLRREAASHSCWPGP